MSTKESKVSNTVAARLALRDEIRLDAWRSVLERTNRIVSGADVRIRLTGENSPGLPDVPGWTDGVDITFNRKMLLDSIKTSDAVTAVLRLKGLNYHELSHVLYTPRADESIVKKVLKRMRQEGRPNLTYAFNALEDQRIETTFSAMYGPSRRYFEAMVLKYLVEEGTSEAAILLHGRKYLDPKIRVRAQDAFVAKYGQALFDEFAAVIDSYLVINYPTNSLLGERLIVQYASLLDRMQNNAAAQLPKPVIDDQQHDNAPHGAGVVSQGRKAGASDQKAAAKAVEDMVKDAAKADAEQRQKDQEKSKDSGQAGNGQDANGQGEGSDGQTPSDGQGQPSDSDGQNDSGGGISEGASEGAGGAGAGTDSGKTVSPASAIRELIEAAEDGLDDIHDDEDVQDDADSMMDAVRAVENNGDYRASGGDAFTYGKTPAQDTDLRAVRRITTIVQQIRASAEPEILRGQAAGRVDVRRALGRSLTDTEIFTRYDEGALDDTGMEVVLLMDNSGSMGRVMAHANAAMWCLKRSFDRLGILCTVIVYDTEHTILYRSRDKAGGQIPNVGTRGGTDPTSALNQALRIFAKSNEPNKVLITVTDGSWSLDARTETSIMKTMKASGVTSLLVGLCGAVSFYGKHRHDVGFDIEDVSTLPKAVTEMVSAIMRRVLSIA